MRYRRVDSRLWSDAKIRRLTDDGKLAFLFVLTHPHMTSLGAMRGTLRGLAAELGWTPTRFSNALRPAIELAMVEVNEAASYVALPNFLKYNPPNGPNAASAWLEALALIPECPERLQLIARCRRHLDRTSDGFRLAITNTKGDAFWDAFADAKGDASEMPSPIQEQEQEQQQEQETPHSPPRGAKHVDSQEARAWVDILNREAGAKFKPVDANLKPIRARLREGFTLEQAKLVAAAKVHEWRGTENAKYLRPETLFGPKFDGYLQAAMRNTNGHDPKRVNDAWASETAGEVRLWPS